jgi:hypothetical protein
MHDYCPRLCGKCAGSGPVTSQLTSITASTTRLTSKVATLFQNQTKNILTTTSSTLSPRSISTFTTASLISTLGSNLKNAQNFQTTIVANSTLTTVLTNSPSSIPTISPSTISSNSVSSQTPESYSTDTTAQSKTTINSTTSQVTQVTPILCSFGLEPDPLKNKCPCPEGFQSKPDCSVYDCAQQTIVDAEECQFIGCDSIEGKFSCPRKCFCNSTQKASSSTCQNVISCAFSITFDPLTCSCPCTTGFNLKPDCSQFDCNTQIVEPDECSILDCKHTNTQLICPKTCFCKK